MGEVPEKLNHELKAAQITLAEAKALCINPESEHQSVIKKTENTCKQIEQAHQGWMSVLDAVKDLIFVHDKDFRVFRCNPTYQPSDGIFFKQIIGQPCYEIFPKTHAPLPNYRRRSESDNLIPKDNEFLPVNGKIYRSHAAVIKNEIGRLSLLHASHRRHCRGQAGRKSDARKRRQLRGIADSAQYAILMMDSEGKITYRNKAADNILGYASHQMIGAGVA